MIETALSRLGTVRSATLMTGDQIRLEDLPQLIPQFTVEAKGDSNGQTLTIEKACVLGASRPSLGRKSDRVAPDSGSTRNVERHAYCRRRPQAAFELGVAHQAHRGILRARVDHGMPETKHRGKTARSPGLSRKTLYNKIKKLRILE
ncbi:hypothetical protein [Bradyrhizobium sp. 23]|uniref:hypothetical protein n=1 Tax=Bradyrhizobium sp. 23 TaxID=2782667 RepID=UPI001FFB57F3|nr:hypothetical protein [Bradyrhizobium sp. 23]